MIEKLSEKLRGIAVTDKLLHRPINTTLREAFKKMDTNELELLPARSAVKEMDVPIDEDELKLACVYLDDNKDGAIHWDEFISKLVKTDGGVSLYVVFEWCSSARTYMQ